MMAMRLGGVKVFYGFRKECYSAEGYMHLLLFALLYGVQEDRLFGKK